MCRSYREELTQINDLLQKWIKMSEGAFIFFLSTTAFTKQFHLAQANRVVLV